MEKQVYTAEEATKLLGVNYHTMFRWLRTGLIKGKKLGRLWRIRRDSMNMYLGPMNK